MNIRDYRKAEYPIDPLFLERWSPRAFSGEPLTDKEILSLFEAARWAPSAYNNQPWRFLYAVRGTKEWDSFMDLLVEFNQSWAKNTAVLVVILSRKNFEHNGKPSVTHSFDTGAAWAGLALQAHLKGWAAHGMQGFDYEKARQVLNVPEDYDVEAMAAVGKLGRKEDLPEELGKREVPSTRKTVKEIARQGKFSF